MVAEVKHVVRKGDITKYKRKKKKYLCYITHSTSVSPIIHILLHHYWDTNRFAT